MKTIGLILGGAVLAAMTATTVFSDTIQVAEGPYHFSDAGELTVTTVGGPNPYLSSYASVAQVNGGFQTFAEDTIPVYLNQTYGVATSQTDVSGHALSQGAALLYYDFSQGDLPGYEYTANSMFTSYERVQDAGLLQAAIWAFQGYANPTTNYASGTLDNPFYSYALSVDPNALSANDGLYDVSILELSNGNGLAQNLLVANTPDNDTTWAMLAGSVAMILAAHRKLTGAASQLRARANC